MESVKKSKLLSSLSDDKAHLGQKEVFLDIAPSVAAGKQAVARDVRRNRYQMTSGRKHEDIRQASPCRVVDNPQHSTPAAQGFDAVRREARIKDGTASLGAFESNDSDVIALVEDKPQLHQPSVSQAEAALGAVQNHAAPPQPQAQPEVQAQQKSEPLLASTALSKPLDVGEEEDKLFNYDYIDADLTWMEVALVVGRRSEIPKYVPEEPGVGCAIVSSRSKDPSALLAVGCNGFLPKISEEALKNKAAEYDRLGKPKGLTNECALHAEINALQNCSKKLEKATAYVTHVPCHGCAKQLASKGVERVFYLFWMESSESLRSIELFALNKISCIPFPARSRHDVFHDPSNGKICVGDTTQDIPKKKSFHLNEEDSKGGTSSDLKGCVSDDYSRKILEDLKAEFDELRHEFREDRNQKSIKIVGMPEKSPEETALDTSSLCVSLFKEMGVEINIDGIDKAQRTMKGRDSNGPRPIICKFVRGLARDDVMSVKQKARNVGAVKIGFSEDTDVSNISISIYDDDSQEMTEGASSTQ